MTRLQKTLPDATAVVLVLLSLAVPLAIVRGKSATFDEVSHLPAGHSYLTTGLVRLNPQHPPLVKELCALPLLSMRLRSVDRETLARADLPPSFEWQYGRAFLYGQDAERILLRGRVPAAAMSFGLAALVWAWSRARWGAWAGALAAALYALDPTITAHAPLVTTDVGCAFFSMLAVLALRNHLAAPSLPRLAVAGGALGLALGAKYSALVLLPVCLVFLATSRISSARRAGVPIARAAAGFLADAAVVTAVAGAVLWVIYLAPSDPLFYWRGLARVHADHDPGYWPYLMGDLRPGGWRSYLLVAALVKTPLPTLLVLLAALAAAAVRWRRLDRDDALLLAPAASYFAAYSLGADNLGVRYLIPCLPFLFVFAGRLAAGRPAVPARVALAGLVLWGAAESAAIAPDHLSYFNQIAGGARSGYRWLNDSNVDWGQGLPQLRSWLGESPRGAYAFCYFGSAPPAYYGLAESDCSGLLSSPDRPPSGTLILSAHWAALLNGLLRRSHGDGPGNWIVQGQPVAYVGHAYFVYELR
jgi:hypothetical protein